MILRMMFGGLALAVAASTGVAAQQAGQGDAAQGKTTYMADGCYDCHGGVGQGGRATGPRIARTQLPIDAFRQQLRQPSNEMPPYEAGVVSDAEAANIYAYLQSLPEAKAAKDIPLLNQ
jgi:cytochrome c553